mgnify:FL=1
MIIYVHARNTGNLPFVDEIGSRLRLEVYKTKLSLSFLGQPKVTTLFLDESGLEDRVIPLGPLH